MREVVASPGAHWRARLAGEVGRGIHLAGSIRVEYHQLPVKEQRAEPPESGPGAGAVGRWPTKGSTPRARPVPQARGCAPAGARSPAPARGGRQPRACRVPAICAVVISDPGRPLPGAARGERPALGGRLRE